MYLNSYDLRCIGRIPCDLLHYLVTVKIYGCPDFKLCAGEVDECMSHVIPRVNAPLFFQ